MEIKVIQFESTLIIIQNKQEIHITPFLTSEHGNIKLGIDAPKGISIDREEVYKRKKKIGNEK
jgi:carbon storage regulator